MKPHLAITMGDPAGVGPEIIVRACHMLRPRLEAAGLVVSGTTSDGRLVEICELPGHPWFVASQFHPEFKSRPTRPAPLFRDFVGAAVRLRTEREDELEETCAPA